MRRPREGDPLRATYLSHALYGNHFCDSCYAGRKTICVWYADQYKPPRLPRCQHCQRDTGPDAETLDELKQRGCSDCIARAEAEGGFDD